MESNLYDSLIHIVPRTYVHIIKPRPISIKGSNNGLIKHTVIVQVIDLKMPIRAITERIGIKRSKTTKSFEKRVSIRPIGFESKKRIFAWMTFYDITLCILVFA